MWVEMQPSAQSTFRSLNVDNSCQKTRKIRCYIFEVLSNFTVFVWFVPNILARITVVQYDVAVDVDVPDIPEILEKYLFVS